MDCQMDYQKVMLLLHSLLVLDLTLRRNVPTSVGLLSEELGDELGLLKGDELGEVDGVSDRVAADSDVLAADSDVLGGVDDGYVDGEADESADGSTSILIRNR
jgi:hypothetical protein